MVLELWVTDSRTNQTGLTRNLLVALDFESLIGIQVNLISNR